MEIRKVNLNEFIKRYEKHTNLVIALGNHISVTFTRAGHASNSEQKEVEIERKRWINSVNYSFVFNYTNRMNTETWEEDPLT